MDETRRDFLKKMAVVAGGTALAGCTNTLIPVEYPKKGEVPEEIWGAASEDIVETDYNVETRYAVCQMCPGFCGVKARLFEGRLLKLDGNPYHPNTMEPHITYQTPPEDVIRYTGSLCVKGQSGIQTLYNPLRIKQPLKRVGPRGSGKWETISWEQAITEIVEGGNLFGEGYVGGLRSLRDLNSPLDPAAPEMGPKANQFAFMMGESGLGQHSFIQRFLKGYGTVNISSRLPSIGSATYHTSYRLSLNGDVDDMKPDILNAEYVIFFGTSPLEANFPSQALVRKLMKSQGILRGGSEALQEEEREKVLEFNLKRLKWVVVDPRLSATASNADQWIAVKPGTDAALALGMARWIIANRKYDRRYLENSNRMAAQKDGEPTWTDATYLVRLDNMSFMRSGGDYMVSMGGVPVSHSRAEHGELEAAVEVNGVRCKSVFALLKEKVMAKSIEEYALMAGVEPRVIEGLAREFTSYGKKAVADFYNGVTKHTNGLYTARSIIVLNMLVGNIDWKGGLVKGGGGWDYMGAKPGAKYKLLEIEGAPQPKGVRINRAGHRYEESTEYRKKGYPARRPWFPLAEHGNYQEVLASIAEGYPYPIKALMLCFANPVYSVPGAADPATRVLKDMGKIPLLVVIDVEMSETAALADYILPDTTYLEKWFITSVSPAITCKTVGVGQPVMGQLNASTGEYTPLHPETRMVEDILIDIAKRLRLPGFGERAFQDGGSLHRAWDFYRRAIANVAYDSSDGSPVPGATEEEKVEYVLKRGGRFEDYGKDLDRVTTTHPYGDICHIYSDLLATTRDSFTGETYHGLPVYKPVTDVAGREIKDEEYPFQLLTHKYIFHALSRTVVNRWLMEVLPENFVALNPGDATALGLKKGDRVALRSRSFLGEIYGQVFLMDGIRPGVLVVPHSYGHWEMGSKLRLINGKKSSYDSTRGAGIVAANAIMRLDPLLEDVSLQDKIGGCASLFDTKVSVVKV